MFYKIQIICLLISKYAWDGSIYIYLKQIYMRWNSKLYIIYSKNIIYIYIKTYVNIRRAFSFNAGTGLFAHWNRNCRNSGHWLLPSSSIKFLATSAATSQTLRRIVSVCSFWTDNKICSFNWACASGGI